MILHFTRTWLPAIVVVLGVVLWLLDPTADTALGAAGIIGAGLSIWLLNVLFRIGVKGDVERDQEDDARRFFDEHGYWPDEQPPTSRQPPRNRHRDPRPGGRPTRPASGRAPRRPS